MAQLWSDLRHLLCLLCLLAPAALCCPGAQAAPHHAGKQKPKQIISELEREWRSATLAGDATQLDHILSDDYVGISWTGQVNTKTMQLDRLRKHTLVLSRMDLGDLKIKLIGPVAIVTSHAEIAGTNDGQDVHGIFRYTRVYQRQPSGTWKVTNFEATRIPTPGDQMIHPVMARP